MTVPIVWESKALFAVRDWLRRMLRSDRLVTGLILLFSFIIISYSLRPIVDVYRSRQDIPYEYKEMGLWMNEHVKAIEEEYVVCGTPCVSFCAGQNI